jgi:23S rRNA (adenine2503-C2)-methyltransferase
MMPHKNLQLHPFLRGWMTVKNEVCDGNAGLQLSINSTDEDERYAMFSGRALGVEEIADAMALVAKPKGRKITLNFAVADYTVDAGYLASLFSPEHYLCKLTPMHKTAAAVANGVKTEGDYTTYHPYQDLEDRLKAVGYDVLVFIASREEDEGRITCGNAILSGTKPFDVGEGQP